MCRAALHIGTERATGVGALCRMCSRCLVQDVQSGAAKASTTLVRSAPTATAAPAAAPTAAPTAAPSDRQKERVKLQQSSVRQSEGVEQQRAAIKSAMAHSWKGYRQYAFWEPRCNVALGTHAGTMRHCSPMSHATWT